jgi:hypothetical protein
MELAKGILKRWWLTFIGYRVRMNALYVNGERGRKC